MTQGKIRLFSTLFAGAAFAACLTGAALAAEPATNAKADSAAAAAARTERLLSANNTVLADVPVVARRTRAADEVLRLDTRSASSCAFDPRIDGYLGALAYVGVRPSSYGYGYFSESNPYPNYGGFSSYGFRRSADFFDYDLLADGCRRSDYNFAAGRAYIARKDKTLPAGYAAYEAGNYAEAQVQFQKAFHKLPDGYGGTEAALMLGRVILERNANPADAPEAMKWLKYASGAPLFPSLVTAPRGQMNPNDPSSGISTKGEAAAILGKMYFVGYGVPADHEQALKWFKIAVTQGHIPAAKIVGDIYFNGYGVPRDVKAAQKYYKMAADRGYPAAQVALGDLYYYGDVGSGPDVEAALALYSKASGARDPGALYALAHAYDAGEGVPRDAEKALGYYKLAALGGDARARGAIGDYFYRGEIVERDPAIARKWFATAAAGGEADAMFNLAAMMANGEGGDTDRARAWALMKVADAKGHPTADEGLAALEAKMSVAEREAGQALLAAKD